MIISRIKSINLSIIIIMHKPMNFWIRPMFLWFETMCHCFLFQNAPEESIQIRIKNSKLSTYGEMSISHLFFQSIKIHNFNL